MGMKDELVKLIKELDCIKYGDFILASGKKSDYKIDMEPLFWNKNGRLLIYELGIEKIKEIDNDYYWCGVNTGGVYFGALLADILKKDFLVIDHKKNIVMGKFSRENI